MAPVSADIGFMVMLPQSLYQTSAWMRLLTVVSKPAAVSRSASALTRPDAPPPGSPMIRPRPKPCFTRPGSRTEQVACTTQPITCRTGIAAVTYFRVIDPTRSIVDVEDFMAATLQIAQTTLRSVLGKAELDTLLAERERLNESLQQIIDEQTEPWGVKVTIVEIK